MPAATRSRRLIAALTLSVSVGAVGTGGVANAADHAATLADYACRTTGTAGDGGSGDVTITGPDGPAQRTLTTVRTDGTSTVVEDTIELVGGRYVFDFAAQPEGLLRLAVDTVQILEVAVDCFPDAGGGYSADWDGDGRADLVADDLQGRLWFYPGTGTGGFGARTQIGSGWTTRDQVRPVGDWNGDGNDDLVARNTGNGDLILYAGNGSGGFSGFPVIGRGWNVFREIIGLGDWDGDGAADLAAVRRDNGALVLYPGNGSGGFGAVRQIGSGWAARTGLTSTGDWNGDGNADFAARNSQNGDLILYAGNGRGGFSALPVIGRGWGAFTALVGLGDWSGDGPSDILARTGAGDLVMYRGNGAGGFLSPYPVVGRGWNAFELNAPGSATPPPTTPPPTSPATGTVAHGLSLLQVATENRTGYDRDLFRHWTDPNGDCQNTRAEVLQVETRVAVTFTTSSRCTVSTGRWYSAVDGVTWTRASDVDIDHHVALAEAWDSGARSWTAARRESFANDTGYASSLNAMTDDVNSSKSDSDPAQWLPPLASARCSYAAQWIAVKYRWNLTVDAAEKRALGSVASGTCGTAKLTLPPRA